MQKKEPTQEIAFRAERNKTPPVRYFLYFHQSWDFALGMLTKPELLDLWPGLSSIFFDKVVNLGGRQYHHYTVGI